MKMLLFSTINCLLLIIIFGDLVSASYYELMSGKNTHNGKSYLSIVSIGEGGKDGNEEYFLGVTEEYAILSKKGNDVQSSSGGNNSKKSSLSIIDSQQFPNGFRLERDIGCTLTFLPRNNTAFLCSNNMGNSPACLLMGLSSGGLGSMDPVVGTRNGSGYGSSEIWNTFRLLSENGDSVITAYLNGTRVYEPSWIIRETLGGDGRQSSKATGIAFDHHLPLLKSDQPTTETVFAFRYDGFGYFLRYAYRYKHVAMTGDVGYEWAWVLSRVCFGDQTKALRSRMSIPLDCHFPKLASEGTVGWRPTQGYLDEPDGQLYLYVQPNVSVTASHRICAFDMAKVVAEFERTFDRCFRQFSPGVAVHGALPMTMVCSDYGKPDWPCGFELCNPEECIVDPRYYAEVYEPVCGSAVATINFAYQRSQNEEDRPSAMYLTKDHPGALFVQKADGNVFMAFLSAPESGLSTPQPAAWTSEADGEHEMRPDDRMLEARDRSGVLVISGDALLTLTADCGLYSKCDQLMERSTGEQARRIWDCGWCRATNTKYGGFSSTRDQCDKADGYFHQDSCPPAAYCYNPLRWTAGDHVPLEITGYFPASFQYLVMAGGADCPDVKITRGKAQHTLTCTLLPLSHQGGVEISVLDPLNSSSVVYQLEPACRNDTALSVDGMQEWNGAKDKTLLVAALGTSALLLSALLVYALARRRRRQKKRRDRNYNSLSLPMTRVTVEMSRNNEYVQRNVLGRNENNNQVYEDLSGLVPPGLLVDFDAIACGEVIGQGHFGQVFRGEYTPSENAPPVAVAVKTLIMEADAKQFLQEGILMESFDHPRVLSIIGIAFGKNHLPMLVTPFMARGDLLKYIRNAENAPSVGELLQFGVEIAEGMRYLHQLKFIHRDLAARNCMLDGNNRVKIADFGLSRDVYESECYMSNQNTDLPIRWMPPESIELKQYTLKSDVWSYGVVLWELTTRGEVPYAGMTGFQVLTYLKSGSRLARPSHCPKPVYQLIRLCWETRPDQRPDFPALNQHLPAAIHQVMRTASYQSLVPAYYNLAPVQLTTA